jgi:glycosyltransferase involved in cell wall biosynthesis
MSISNSNSLVSIIITTYNHGNFIADAINSALFQSYKNIEILVIDDGSTDNTRDIVSKYKDVVYYYQKNQGLPAARNSGIEKAKGEFISFLDADDFLYPEGIEINLSYLISNENIAFVSGAYKNVDEEGKETQECSIHVEGNNFHNLLVKNYIGNHNTVMYRKNIIEKYLYDIKLKCVEDYDIYLRISKDYLVAHHNKFIAAYRRLSNSMSSNVPLMLTTIIKVRKNSIKDNILDTKLKNLCRIGIKNAKDYFVNIAKIQLFDTKIGSKMKFSRWAKTFVLILRYKPLLLVKVLIIKIKSILSSNFFS